MNFTNYNLTVSLKTPSATKQNIKISLERPTTANQTLDNYTNIFLVYLNASSSEVSMNMTIVYDCKYGTGIAPFVLENNTWAQIYTAFILKNPCRITFPAPNKHTIGLFVYSPKNITSTTVASTITTTINEKQRQIPVWYYYAAALIIALVVAAYLFKSIRTRHQAL